jgi:menaquinone-dependent protoporphyrinogen IX oxidase
VTAVKTTGVRVAFASKHGATQGIAERIGSTLRASGLCVCVTPIDVSRTSSPMTPT